MTAVEANNITLKNIKTPPGIEPILENIFIKIKESAEKGKNYI